MKKSEMTIAEMQELANVPVLSDAILALFFKLKQDKITKNSAVLHSKFMEISKSSKIKLLNSLIYDTSSLFPFCDELDESFFFLEMGALPYIIEPQGSYYVLDDTRDVQEKSYKRFNEAEQADIDEHAKSLVYLPKWNGKSF